MLNLFNGLKQLCFVFLILLYPISVIADNKINDENLNISNIELENAVKYWPKQLLKQSTNDEDVQIGLLRDFLLNKKISKMMDNVSEEIDEEFYWQQQFAIRNLQNKLYFKNFKEQLKIPNMEDLAREMLQVNRDKYALVPERRKASHILIKCLPGQCDRKEKRPRAEKVIKELKEGTEFEVLVQKYSDDPGSKKRKGKLKNWIKKGEPKVNAYFVEGLFTINEKGSYSDITETKFGFHIIRLDDIEEKSYKSESEVLPIVIDELEKKYRAMSLSVHTKNLAETINSEEYLGGLQKIIKSQVD